MKGACITDDSVINVLKLHENAMINAMVNNHKDGLDGFNGICELLGVAETMARNGIGPEVLDSCAIAQNTLQKLKKRYDRWGKWDVTEKELHSINELMEWHNLQRTSVSRGEYERFLKMAKDRMRSRAPEVIEI